MASHPMDQRPLQAERLEAVLSAAEAPPGVVVLPAPVRGAASRFSRNSAMSVGRLLASTLVALVLPAYLLKHLPLKTYSAWVLLLQMSAYVAYLDFGVQTGIAKYVAEFDARGDRHGANMRASAGLAMMVLASIVGVALTAVLAWRVPHLFSSMPPSLYRDVRISLVFVGCSLSFGLICAVPSSIFLGLQRFAVPTLTGLLNRVLYTIVILSAVLLHGSLAVMGALVALVNVFTGLIQVAAWRRMAGHIRLSLRNIDRGVLRQMFSYCSVLAIWTVGMLCVSGLDVTIVGHYDYPQTAFYSMATLPTNFIISIVASALGPLLPSASALSAQRTPAAMGDLLGRLTRYAVLLLGLTAVPLMVCAYWVMHLWVGHDVSIHTIAYLRILVLANILRNIGLPYATMLVATESQKFAIAGATAEAVVNLSASIYLVQHFGAIGVAYGTLLGAFVSVSMHFAVGMHYTVRKFAISRVRLFCTGVLQPAIMTLPSLVTAALWWRPEAPRFSLPGFVAWAVSTGLLGWFAGLSAEERGRLLGLSRRRLHLARR